MTTPYYVTTPIYYVNDRPHIGHCYTTLVADVAARAQRLIGRDVFFLTGTDEHAEKVSKTAEERGLSPYDWATKNADRFREAFGFMGFSNTDFVRTTEERHTSRASAYIQRLVDSGDIELGDYEGWYDPSQEEYLTETIAKDNDFKSPVTGRPLEKRVEQNYFFKLDKYESWLREQISSDTVRVLPEARKNEVLGRIATGLQPVPVSRRIREGDADWGIRMPNDPDHRIYVWIEALCNYLTVVDTDDRRKYWPCHVHLMAKDILWFHAVIWPAMLHALGEPAPACVYAHAYFISEGRKMSKSLGNFIEIDQLEAYAERYSLDAVRWFLAYEGPLGANDADFAYARFVEVYNAHLANGIGNAVSRVANMIAKYFGGAMPEYPGRVVDWDIDGERFDFATDTREAVALFERSVDDMDLRTALTTGITLLGRVDGYIAATRPFSIAKGQSPDCVPDGADLDAVLRQILCESAEALRIVSLLLSPAMPFKMESIWDRWSCRHTGAGHGFAAPLSELGAWFGAHAIESGTPIEKGDALFMRADAGDSPPG